MTKSAKQILIEARELITPEESWTQGSYARDSVKEPCSGDSEGAECFCSLGALQRVSENTLYRFHAKDLLGSVVGDGIADFNDTHTHAEVLAAFDRAIAIA